MVNGRNKYRIKDIFDLSAGGDVDKEHFSAYKTSEHRYPIYSNSLENHGLYGYTSNPKYSADSVTITGRGSVGHAEYREDEFDAIIRLLVMKPKSSNVCAQFVADYINNCVDFSLESTGVPQLTAPQIMNVELELPHYDEQKEVTTVLADVSSLIDMLGKQISKKKAIKQGTMQELLTGKRRLPGFAGEWEKTVLGTVNSFYTGGTPSKKREDWWNGDIPWISSCDLTEDAITSVNINRYISKDAVEHSATRICPKDAVLVVSRVGVGKVAVAPCELCTSQDFTTIVPHRHNPHFLAYMLIPVMKELAMQAQGTSIKGVTVEDIQKIIMPTPTIDEQNQIVDILANMDSEIEALEQKLEKYRQVKQGMMQQLLTGKIRLV